MKRKENIENEKNRNKPSPLNCQNDCEDVLITSYDLMLTTFMASNYMLTFHQNQQIEAKFPAYLKNIPKIPRPYLTAP